MSAQTSVMEYNGKNAIRVQIGHVVFWYSYNTIVAFYDGKTTRVSQNPAGTTTERHISAIDGGSKEAKQNRMQISEFKAVLDGFLKEHNLV